MLKRIQRRILSLQKSNQKVVKESYIPKTNDIFLVSYPKSGNTWLRFLIGNYLSGNQCNFTNSHLIIPDIHYNSKDISKIEEPRIIKSHYPFCSQYRQVIYLVRDGRDVAVSYYYHYLKYSNNTQLSFEEYLEKFNAGEVNFGLWSDHVNSWMDQFDCIDRYLLLKYEEIQNNPLESLKKIIQFVGLAVDEEKIMNAVEASQFEKMQSLEKEAINQIDLLSKSDTKINFVRSGKTSQWKDLFTEKMINDFINIHSKALTRLDYA